MRTRVGQKIEALPGDGLKSGLPALLMRLDQEILPELRRLVSKNQQLGRELRAYRGELGGQLRPSAQMLRELVASGWKACLGGNKELSPRSSSRSWT